MAATRYVDPVPNASARNWGGQQGRAAGMTGSLNSKNVGADYLAPYGSPLYAPIGGNIVQVIRSKYTGTETDPNIRRQAVNENYGWGTSVIIQGDDGFYHRMSHQVPDGVRVKVGDRVDAGQQIGLVGQSGNTQGNGVAGGAPHLDWEKYKSPSGNFNATDRQYVDPRVGDFDSGPQAYTASPAKRYAGENDARGGLNRAALSPQMQQWAGLIEEKADKYGVPPELLAGIVDYESGGKPDAGHPTSGATGLGQVMPKGSGPYFNDRPTKQELLDPETNLEWSAKILAANYKKFNNNPQSAAAAYLGAVDSKGNPTTAADANGTNGFKYVQEVMARTEKFTGAGQSGPSSRGADPVAQQLAQERKMAETTQDIIRDYNNNRTAIDARIKEAESAAKSQQDAYNKALTRSAELQGKAKLTPDEDKEFGRLQLSLPQLQAAAKAANDQAEGARKDKENNDAALSKNLEIIAGKPLNEQEKAKYAADARQANAEASRLETALTMMNRGEPGYEEAKAKADHARLIADNYTRTLDLADRQAGQKDRELGQADRGLGQVDRRIGLEEYEKYATVPATVERTLAAAGLDAITAKRIAARIAPELADLAADTGLKQNQAAYQDAITKKVNTLLPQELAQLVQANRLTQAQADKAIATLPADIAKANQDVRQGQATTGLTQAQTWAQVVDANTKQFEAEMKAREAEVWQQVQKVAANPNSSDEDIIGAIQAGARNATEAAQVYQTRINQYQQQEASRHSKVQESIDIQNADETERNNRYQNLASIQNSRANMQNASTNAIGPRLGATGMANAMAGLGMVTGSEGLNRLAMQSGTGASVIDPVKAGLAPFEKDQATLRAGVRDNRLANPNAEATKFQAPKATAATSGIGSLPVPKLNALAAPNLEQVSFQPPAAGPVAENFALNTSPASQTTSAQYMHSGTGEPPGEMAPGPPPPPDEDEEGTGGGKKPGGGVKVIYNFTPPRAGAKTKSTSVAAKKPPKGKLGTGGGFRVPGRIAA